MLAIIFLLKIFTGHYFVNKFFCLFALFVCTAQHMVS